MRVVVVGGGGHARSVLDALRTSAQRLTPIACTDADPALRGRVVDGVPIVGEDDVLPGLLSGGVEGACLGLGGTADNRPRAVLYERVAGLGFALPSVVHGFAHVACAARLGAAAVVLAGAVVGAGTTVGVDVIVGSRAVIEHDCRIGDHVHLASGSVLGGAVAIGSGAHVGLGATVLQGRTVGERAVVGAGAVVIHDVPAETTVVGCPASATGARA